jgi:ATP-dependent DNA helicase DinG
MLKFGLVGSFAAGGVRLQISWTRLPFKARNQAEFNERLSEWLSLVFYEILPAKGYEVREEQIYTAFRMAGALGAGTTLMAEAGPGTGKTFAYLLPAICYARMKGAPVVVASASGVLQAQLSAPDGDIQTLSRLLDLNVDARVAADPGAYICEVKVRGALPPRPFKGWKAMRAWTEQTGTGARTEVPDVADELWELFAWDPSLPCDTCHHRGHCHVMNARRNYREAPDLVVCNHRLFATDLLTRAERHEAGLVPLLPAYSAVVLDEGHHVPETWQRTQGHELHRRRLESTLDTLDSFVDRTSASRAVDESIRCVKQFFAAVAGAAEPGEGKRHVAGDEALLLASAALDGALERLQDELVTDEAMNEGRTLEMEIQSYQSRLDLARAALRLFRAPDSVAWVENNDLWVVPRHPAGLFDKGHLSANTPVIFSSATLEAEYQARLLHLSQTTNAKVGVPFDLAEQALVYEPAAHGEMATQVVATLHASQGRALVLLNSKAEVRSLRAALEGTELPWELIWEGDGESGALLERFRSRVASVLVGSGFWEGVDVPGEALSCVIIPRLPFPEHDPLIRERRRAAQVDGHDPFTAVDLPEMTIKLKQGAGRLIRTAADRGVLALLDRSWVEEPWAAKVEAALPEDAERTDDLARVADFLGT